MASPTDVENTSPQRPPGLLLFASTQAEQRARRPTDIALAITSLLLFIGISVLATLGSNLDEGFADVLTTFPGFFDPLWQLLFWTPMVWALVLVILAFVRRRPSLGRDLLAGAVISVAIATTGAAIVTHEAWDVLSLFGDVNGPPVFPPGPLAIASAVICTASPHLSRPFRHFGRWGIAGQLTAALFLGATTPAGEVAAVAAGLLAAATVHLAVGSPGGRPTASRIRLALEGLGVMVDDLVPAAMYPRGVVLFSGSDHVGPISVKVYGRDAWDGQLLANLWRLVWYRDMQRTARLSRVELVEHEGFVTLLAERAGVRVPRLVTAGSAGRGDALVVVRQEGTPLAGQHAEVDDGGIAALWTDLRRLHDAGIAHRQIDVDHLLARPDGTVSFSDLSSASLADDPALRLQDRAQLLGVTILLAGEDRAVAAARAALGDDGVISMLPYVQEAAMSPTTRDALARRHIELDQARKRVGVLLGAGEQDLVKLRRVTWGAVVNLALLSIAAYALVAVFSGVDFDSFLDDLRHANWWWLVFALLLAQLPRVPAAISTMGSIEHRLPLGPLTALQFAICFVNLAIPSTAARVAINVRFFQRVGVGPTTAISAGVIDSVSGFVVQIVLFLGLFFVSDVDLHLTTDTTTTSGWATIALIVIAAIIVLGVIVMAVSAVRRRVVAAVREARVALRVLRSPIKLLQLFGGNLLSQVMFTVALAACVFAFGADVPLSELLLISTVVSLFAGLLPVPGGIGVAEAGFTIGLQAAGLSAETAFAIALTYRFASFYLPPIWGWFCYRWLVRARYL
jgi:uncharacterized membrane protein YbhN (UPF0104 family)